MQQKQGAKGFTLLELLIVIAIIAILSVILVLVLNPAETLRKSRDAQRISDLNTVKTALGLYLTATTSPYLAGNASNAACVSGARIQYLSVATTSDMTETGFVSVSATTSASVNSTGWIPVNLSSLTGGSPIASMPLDPVNTLANTAAIADTDYMYRYACNNSPIGFEMTAKLESNAYTIDDNRATKDGGNNSTLYEVGTDLTIIN